MSERRRNLSGWGCLSAVVATVGLVAGGCVVLSSRINMLSSSSSSLPDPPPAKYYGTAREVGTRGDDPNPNDLYHGAFPSDDETQERAVGGLPARFSGYTVWANSATRIPARRLTDGYAGSYLRVNVTVFNRDTQEQHICACDFEVWTKSHGYREADAVGAPTVARYTRMAQGTKRTGDVYLYVGRVPGPYFVVFDPDTHVATSSSSARGVWQVSADR